MLFLLDERMLADDGTIKHLYDAAQSFESVFGMKNVSCFDAKKLHFYIVLHLPPKSDKVSLVTIN
jgi:hypothetical protein